MMRKFILDPKLVWTMTLWAALISVRPSAAFAFPTESLQTVQPVSLREAQIDKIMSLLSRPEARLHLGLMRINESQVRDSLTKLDDAELAQVSQRADAVKAAGDGALGIVIAVLVIVLLIVLIMNLSNKKIEIKDDHK